MKISCFSLIVWLMVNGAYATKPFFHRWDTPKAPKFKVVEEKLKIRPFIKSRSDKVWID